MSDYAAIQATFSDFKLIRGRKVAQLIYEVPMEQADAALAAMGGVPSPAAERWVGIARLDLKAAQRAPEARQSTCAKTPREFASLPYAQQAALKCGDGQFQAFLRVTSAEEAAVKVRRECKVNSRSEIETSELAKERWHAILRDFEQYQRGFR